MSSDEKRLSEKTRTIVATGLMEGGLKDISNLEGGEKTRDP